MNEHVDRYPRWVSPDVLTAYRQERDGAGVVSITGLVLYGPPVDSTRLRQLNFRTLVGDGPTWNRSEPPPSEEELLTAPRTVPAGLVGRTFTGAEIRLELAKAELAAGELTRKDSPDDFYRRVAIAYRALATDTGRPTTAIAELQGVPRSTAARWVRQARLRGYLPRTTAGRVS